jgi:hypothetical protein
MIKAVCRGGLPITSFPQYAKVPPAESLLLGSRGAHPSSLEGAQILPVEGGRARARPPRHDHAK